MKKIMRSLTAVAVVAVYLLVLRFIAPSREPYFVLGTAVVGLVAWLCGTISGLAAALLLVPATSLIYAQFPVSTSYTGFASSPGFIGMQIFAVAGMGYLRRRQLDHSRKDAALEAENERLRNMLKNVKELGGLHNLCSHCKSIQDEDGSWQHVDEFLKEKTKMEFSHCICPQCAERFLGSDSKIDPA